MVLIDTVSFKVDSSVDHLATDWEVSDVKDFSNILLSSYEDYKNKNGIIFSDNLSTNKKYYARARGLLTTGYTRWGNIDVFSVINDADLQPQDILPSRVSIPMLSTYRINTTAGVYSLLKKNQQEPTPETNPAPDTDPVTTTTVGTGSSQTFYDQTEIRSLLEATNSGSHDLTLFEIWAEGFETIGTSKHLATTWWIENKDGNVIWSKIKDQVNLTRIEFNNTILKSDEIYRIKAVFHTDSNDVSQIGSLTIVTGYCGEIEVSTYLDAVDYSVDLDLQISWIPGLETIYWEILSFEGNLINSVWSTTTSSILTVLPKGTLKRNVNYILRVHTNLENCYKYIPFITTDSLSESPDDPMTPLLVYPTSITLYKNDTAELFLESQVDNISFTVNNFDIFEYDETTSIIRGKKLGTGTMTIIAKKEGYTANYTTITVNVIEDKGSTEVNSKYVKLSPTVIEDLPQGDKTMVSAITNCEKLTFQLSDDKVAVNQYAEDVFEITGVNIGSTSMMVIGYDSDGATASRILDINVTKGSLDPDEPEPEPEPEFIFTVDKESLEVAASGGTATINVITNAMFWDVTSVSHSNVITVEKPTVNTLRVIGGEAGTAFVTIVANDGETDLGEITIKVIVGKISLPTTFEPLDLINHCEINKDVIVEFISNITTPEEYDLAFDSSLITVKQKGVDRIVFTIKEAAAGKTVPVTVKAHKNESATTVYSDYSSGFNLTVKNLSYTKDQVLRLPEAADDGKRYYAGTTYRNNIPAAPNPIPFTFYVNKDVKIEDITVTSPLWEDGTGAVINTILDPNPILEASSPYFEFKKFTFGIVTNPTNVDDTVGIDNSNHNYKINITVKYQNDTHVENVTLYPLEQLYLNFVLADQYVEKGKCTDGGVYTNGTTLELQSSDKNIAEIKQGAYTDSTGLEREGVYVEAKNYGTVRLTVAAKNRANEAVLAEQIVTVIDPTINTQLSISPSYVETIEGCTSSAFTVTTDSDATVSYNYEDAYITVNDDKTVTGKLVGNYQVEVIAARPNSRPVSDYLTVIVYAANEVPRDFTVAVENLTVNSEESVETTFTIFRDSVVTYELVPNLGKLTLTDITEPDPTPDTSTDTEDTDEESKEDEKPVLTPKYSTYKLAYEAPFTTADTNVVVKLKATYQTLEMNDKDVAIAINKKVLPTGAKINNTLGSSVSPQATYVVETTRPSNTTVMYMCPPGVSKCIQKISGVKKSEANGIITDTVTLTSYPAFTSVVTEDIPLCIIMTTYYKGVVAETIQDTTTIVKANANDAPVTDKETYEVSSDGEVTGSFTVNDYVTVTAALDPNEGTITVTKDTATN